MRPYVLLCFGLFFQEISAKREFWTSKFDLTVEILIRKQLLTLAIIHFVHKANDVGGHSFNIV